MTMFRVGPAGIPASLKTDMNAVLNKKFGTTGQNYPPNGWPDDVNLLGPLPEGTASGPIAAISDGADRVPLKSWIINVDPNLTGKNQIVATQTGKNLFNVADYSQIYADRDGVDSYNYRYMIIQLKPNTTYTVSQNSGEYSGTPIILINNALPVGGANYLDLRKASDTKTYTTDSTGQLYIGSVNSYDDVAYSRLQECNVQIEVGSTATTYEPYSAPIVKTIDLGRTIYGGTADIVNGKGTYSYGRIIFDGSNDEVWQKHGSIASWFYIDNAITDGYVNSTENDFMICNLGTQAKYASVAQLSNGQFAFGLPSPTTYRFVFKNTDFTEVADFKAWLSNNNMQVVYKLATPTDFTFTPITPTPETPETHVANFYGDTGDSTVVYRRDIDLALHALSGSRGLSMSALRTAGPISEESDPEEISEQNEEITEQEGDNDAR